jgi:hypothetical protein
MCTVTFIPREVGYYLAMNRDEQLNRIAGQPPQKRFIDGRTILSPSEPGGGTWISLNDEGVCFALINWYSAPARVTAEAISRGEVVRSVSPSCTSEEVDEHFSKLPLSSINPFRLIGIFPDRCEAVEWRWDLNTLVRHECPWQPQQWISSGYDEPQAQLVRSRTFEHTRQHRTAGSLNWVRQLHSSHSPEPGPFSTCMHRDDAATVSYCEIEISPDEGIMRYHAGAACSRILRATPETGLRIKIGGPQATRPEVPENSFSRKEISDLLPSLVMTNRNS